MAQLNGWLEPQSGVDVRDVYGRSYRLGPNDRVLLGYSRVWVAAAAWLVMLAVSGTQYGYGMFAARLMQARPAAHASRGGSAMRIQSPKDARWAG
jgi:hypothetical protein